MRYLWIFLLVATSVAFVGCQQRHNRYPEYRQPERELPSKLVLLDEHNYIRKNRNADPLIMDRSLEEAAESHAKWMAENEKLSHKGANGNTVFKRVGSGYTRIAENIAFGYRTEREVMQAWMDSYGHRKNIVDEDLKYIGFGIKTSRDGTIYYCVVFGA